MDSLVFHKIFLFVFLLFLFHFPSLFSQSSDYSLPDRYFINCGSSSSVTFNTRIYTGDVKSNTFTLSSGSTATSSTDSVPKLYRSARVFRKLSWYELETDKNENSSGTYMVRFHFFPFSSQDNLSDAQFSVKASGFSLLSNFRVQNTGNSPVIKEFLLTINTSGKFKIYFEPNEVNSFAFVNAIEAFLTPVGFIPDSRSNVTPEAERQQPYSNPLSSPLHVIHRINVGGANINQNDDTLLRSWMPDDNYLFNKDSAKNKSYSSTLARVPEESTVFDAPDSVYMTAKEMNINDSRPNNFFNISWNFDVKKRATYFVRVHFCDIVSIRPNEFFNFSLFIYTNFGILIRPYSHGSRNAVPFHVDFVVDSDNSGLMNISVGPLNDSRLQTAFLNGLEIMELIKELGPVPEGSGNSTKKSLFIIIGSGIGGTVLILVVLALFLIACKRKKAKPAETFDWPLGHLDGGNSYSRTTDRTVNGSHLADLNLGLKVPFSEIVYATKNFDTRLLIGEGGFGKVYKGMLRNGTKVAVKRSEPGGGQGLPEFQTEIMVLSKIRHRHLVSLIGYCEERSEMILVYEFMEKGTLRDHLYILRGESGKSTSRSELSWNQRLEICIGAAKGLHYLHTGSDGAIIHRDIKSTNILLDEHYVAKVSDFGLSRSGPLDQTHVITDVKGSFGYLDPEYFRCLQLTQKSDVYSFGVVLLEVLCARPAINNLLPREQINLAEWGMSWLNQGQLEKIVDPWLEGRINPNSLRKFGETVEKCLQESGADRPNIVDVLWDLEYVMQLQRTAMPREPHEDSNTDVTWEVPMPVIQRLPSHSIPFGEDELSNDSYGLLDASQVNASGVFSQLKIGEAR